MTRQADLMTHARAFFDCLYRSADAGLVEYRCLGSGTPHHLWSTPSTIPIADLQRLNAVGYNVYFGVGLRRGKRGRKEDVTALPALWADLDSKDFGGDKGRALTFLRRQLLPALQPSVLVDSGHGIHAYWLLREPYPLAGGQDVARCEEVLRRLAAHLRADRRVAEVARVMRLPGSLNLKDPAQPVLCRILELNPERRFALDDFDLPGDDQPQTASDVPLPFDLERLSRATRLFIHGGAPEGERNQALFAAACDLARCGAQEQVALDLLLPPALASGLPEAEARRTVASAFSRPRRSARQLAAGRPLAGDASPPVTLHLADIDRAQHYRRRVVVPVSVVGVGETFAVPRVIRGVTCTRYRDDAEVCAACPVARPTDVELSACDPLLIAATAVPDQRQHRLIAQELWHRARGGQLHGRPACESGQLAWRTVATQPLTELRVYPLASEVVRSRSRTVDETGKDYRRKDVFYVGAKTHDVQRFLAHGMVLANPKTQVVTLLVDRLEPVEADLAFDPAGVRRWPLEQLDTLLETWSCQVTKVYGRPGALLALLLCYASPLYFRWEGELVKGWVEIGFFGDTTTGKSQTATRTRTALGLGTYVLGECASRSGLLYGIESGTRGHLLIWGELPQNDGRLLMVDGVNAIPREEWAQGREARRAGMVRVRRIVSGEHPCRTRFVAIGNPRQPVSSYRYPCEAIKDLMGEPDIARFDLVVVFDQADIPIEAINAPPGDGDEVDLLWLRHNILRAWQAKPDDLHFTAAARQAIYDWATELTRRYRAANDIPLVANDTKVKLARLSLSLSLLLGQTVAGREHVDYIASYLDRVYRQMRLDAYARQRERQAGGGDEAEVTKAVAWLRQRIEERDGLKVLVENVFAHHHSLRLDDVVAQMAQSGKWSKRTIQNYVAELREQGLLFSSGRGGYTRTAKFVAVLRQMEERSSAGAGPESKTGG